MRTMFCDRWSGQMHFYLLLFTITITITSTSTSTIANYYYYYYYYYPDRCSGQMHYYCLRRDERFSGVWLKLDSLLAGQHEEKDTEE